MIDFGGFFIGLGLGLLILAGVVLWKPQYNPDRCRTNCIGCTIAWDLTQRGTPATARSFESAIFDGPIVSTIYPDANELTVTPQNLKKGLFLRGGQRGYIRYQRRDGSRHMVGYVRVFGLVWVVDPQTSAAKIPLGLYILYDPGTEYRFARLDDIEPAECELLDKITERSER